MKGDDSADGKTEAKEATENEKTETNGDDRKKAAAPAKAAELPAEIQAKLRKLDKLEKTYPGTYRSFAFTSGVVVGQDLFVSFPQTVTLITRRATRTSTLI